MKPNQNDQISNQAGVSTQSVQPRQTVQVGTTAANQPYQGNSYNPTMAPSYRNEPSAAEFDPTTSPASTLQLPRKKSKKKLIILLVSLGALLLLAGGAAYAYMAVYQKPENVVLDAMSKALSAQAIQSKTVVTSDFTLGNGENAFSFSKLTLDMNTNYNPNVQTNAVLTFSIGGKTYNVAADGFVADNGDVYFRVNSVTDILNYYYSRIGTGVELSDKTRQMIKGLENKWIKYSVADMKEQNPDSAKAYSCVIDAYKKNTNNNETNTQLQKAYKDHPFIDVSDKTKSRDGLTGYDVTLNKDKAKQFGEAVKQTQLYKDAKACDPDADPDSVSENIAPVTEDGDTGKTSYTVWVDSWSHTLRQVEVVNTSKPSGADKEFTTKVLTELAYDSSVSFTTPKADMTAKELQEKLTKLSEQLSADAENVPSGTDSIRNRAKKTGSIVRANLVTKKAEAYYAINGDYPKTIADFAKEAESELNDEVIVVNTLPSDTGSLAYKYCGSGSAQVVYKDSTTNKYVSQGLGRGPNGEVTALCAK